MLKNFISGKYNLYSGQIETNSIADKFSNENFYVEKLGSIYSNGNLLNFDGILETFIHHGPNCMDYMRGMFLLLIYDKNKKVISIFHDKSTSPLTMYYVQKDDCVFFSTSLKKLILASKIERRLDTFSATELYKNGVILSRKTLLCNVNKIELFHYLYIDNNVIEQRIINYNNGKNLSEDDAKKNWNKIFSNIINSYIKNDLNEFSMPLSSGYDSNYILHTLSLNNNAKIKAFTIGGFKSNNEIPAVKQIVKNYPNLTLYSFIINPQNFQDFPEVVWRLEGSVLECGIVLQYFLAKMAALENVKKIICGECADEVLNELYFDITASKYEKDKNCIKNLDYQDNPFYITNLLVLKKSSIMFNSFGIETFYPYKSSEFIDAANATVKINRKSKLFHKKNCQKVLSPDIIKHIRTTGGATEFIDLLTEEKFFQLKEYIRNSDCQKYFSHQISLEFNQFDVETVERLIKYLYILVFVELFITGKYDNEFDSETLPSLFSDDLFIK